MHIQTSYDKEAGAVVAEQSWTGSYTGQTAFAAASRAPLRIPGTAPSS